MSRIDSIEAGFDSERSAAQKVFTTETKQFAEYQELLNAVIDDTNKKETH